MFKALVKSILNKVYLVYGFLFNNFLLLGPMNILLEQNLIILIPVLAAFAFSNISNSFIIDFLFSILLQYFLILQSQYIAPVFVTLCLINLSKALLFNQTIKDSDRNINSSMKECLDLVRFVIISQTTICIFMCDFSFWNHRFSKYHFFNIGLMDLGVGCFVFNSGLLSSRINSTINSNKTSFFSLSIKEKKMIKNALLLFSLGVIRLSVVKIFSLDVCPLEYGYHWNFYFTLSFIHALFLYANKIFKLISIKLTHKMHLSCGVFLLASYEYMRKDVTRIILSNNRSNLLLANKEGIASLVPFLGFYMILHYIGYNILDVSNNEIKKEKMKRVAFVEPKSTALNVSKIDTNQLISYRDSETSSCHNEILGSNSNPSDALDEIEGSKIKNRIKEPAYLTNEENSYKVNSKIDSGSKVKLHIDRSVFPIPKLFRYCILNLILFAATLLYSYPSRRICNLSYISWVFQINGFGLLVACILSKYIPLGTCRIVKFSSKLMLEIFLFSNIMVLIFKLSFDLSNLSNIKANLLNIVYLLINFYVLPLLYHK